MTFFNRVAGIFIQDRDDRIAAIIHGASVEAGLVGFCTAQIPGDRFFIGAIQIDMVVQIGREYGKELDRATALGLLESTIGTVVGVETCNQILKYVPAVGNVANTSVAAGVTEALGWATVELLK